MSGDQHLSFGDVDPTALETELGMERYVQIRDLEPQLVRLVQIRASQINGCDYCRDMHITEAVIRGEDQRRLDVVAMWRQAGELFSPRECSALTFVEAVAEVGDDGVPEQVWHDVTESFEPREFVDLLITISTINGWSRLETSTHNQVSDSDLPIAG